MKCASTGPERQSDQPRSTKAPQAPGSQAGRAEPLGRFGTDVRRGECAQAACRPASVRNSILSEVQSTRLYLHFSLIREAIRGSVRHRPPRAQPAARSASGLNADPQAANHGSVDPGLQVEPPASLGHQHAGGQRAQDQQRRQRLLEAEFRINTVPRKPASPARVQGVVEFYEQPAARRRKVCVSVLVVSVL